MKCIFHAANPWSSTCGKSTVGPALLTRVDRRPEEKTMKLRPPPRPALGHVVTMDYLNSKFIPIVGKSLALPSFLSSVIRRTQFL